MNKDPNRSKSEGKSGSRSEGSVMSFKDALLKSLFSNDMDEFRKVLAHQISASNKVHLARKTGVARRTIYDILDPNINFNPALATVAALVQGLSE